MHVFSWRSIKFSTFEWEDFKKEAVFGIFTLHNFYYFHNNFIIFYLSSYSKPFVSVKDKKVSIIASWLEMDTLSGSLTSIEIFDYISVTNYKCHINPNEINFEQNLASQNIIEAL